MLGRRGSSALPCCIRSEQRVGPVRDGRGGRGGGEGRHGVDVGRGRRGEVVFGIMRVFRVEGDVEVFGRVCVSGVGVRVLRKRGRRVDRVGGSAS